jgi:non-specific protein-tyrosine kinase
MKRLQDALSDWADLVLYDSPPVLAVTDAVVLSNRVDGVVLIVQAKKTRLGAVRQAVSHLQQAGGYIIGSVLNRAGGKLGRDFYDYQQYYSSGGGSAPPRAPSTVMPPKKPQSRWAWLSFLGK